MLKIQKTFKNNLPTLYIIGTPIGNLDDVSKRVVDCLKNVEKIYCEDTRVSSVFLNKIEVKKPLVSLHKFNEFLRIEELKFDLENNNNIAIISDAGVPCISDPGAKVIQFLLFEKINFNLTSINCGPAYIHAIASSGFTSIKNIFLGFLDKKKIKNQLIESINNNPNTIISFYESIHRINDTISLLTTILDEKTQVIIGRELTKINEEYIRGNIYEVSQYICSQEFVQKGEICIAFETNGKLDYKQEISFEKMKEEVEQLINNNISKKEAIKQVAKKYKVNKSQLYDEFNK